MVETYAVGRDLKLWADSPLGLYIVIDFNTVWYSGVSIISGLRYN